MAIASVREIAPNSKFVRVNSALRKMAGRVSGNTIGIAQTMDVTGTAATPGRALAGALAIATVLIRTSH
jgi:hypothetical protein